MSRRLHSADVPPIRGQSGVQSLGLVYLFMSCQVLARLKWRKVTWRSYCFVLRRMNNLPATKCACMVREVPEVDASELVKE